MVELINQRDADLRFRVMCYLTDTVLGKTSVLKAEYTGNHEVTVRFINRGEENAPEGTEVSPTEIRQEQEILPPLPIADPCPLPPPTPTATCSLHVKYPLAHVGAADLLVVQKGSGDSGEALANPSNRRLGMKRPPGD